MDYTNSEKNRRNLIGLSADWRAALIWGFGAALLHRLILSVWLIGVWLVVGGQIQGADVDFHRGEALIPPLETPAEQVIFGVWRRWDAVHYLDLATNGYRVEHPGPTVFNPLTPFAFRAADAVLPGGIDLAAMVVETLAFGIALTLIMRVCAVYYNDESLGRWAVAVIALLPLSYFFAAPMSESLYLACALGAFYAAVRRCWWLAAISGVLATLARSQGVLLLIVCGVVALEQAGLRLDQPRTWLPATISAARQAWMLALIPLGLLGFEAYRRALGLPPTSQIQAEISYIFLTDPLNGLLANLRYIANYAAEAVRNADVWALGITFVLALVALRFPTHRRLALITFTVLHLLLFVSKVNYFYGTDVVAGTQSYARYSLILFPLWIMVAAGWRGSGFVGRVLIAALLILSLLLFSGLHVLALMGP